MTSIIDRLYQRLQRFEDKHGTWTELIQEWSIIKTQCTNIQTHYDTWNKSMVTVVTVNETKALRDIQWKMNKFNELFNTWFGASLVLKEFEKQGEL